MPPKKTGTGGGAKKPGDAEPKPKKAAEPKPKKAAEAKPKKAPKVEREVPLYSFRIELKRIKPKIWRRFYCPADTDLHSFHNLIQRVMGWENDHLHSFEINGVQFYEDHAGHGEPFSLPDKSGGWRRVTGLSPGEVELRELGLAANQRFTYEYDFGDGWEHDLKVLSLDFQPEDPDRLVGCLDGEKACPPEDCGGPWGYYRILGILEKRDWKGKRGDPGDPGPLDEDELEFLDEWIGDYDPEDFSAKALDAVLS